MSIYVKGVDIKNIVMERSHILEDVAIVDTMKALQHKQCLINANSHYILLFT